MLILSRREREQIRIGDSIIVTVCKLENDKVRLGIEAPKDVRILRAELPKHNNVRRVVSKKQDFDFE